MFTTMESWSFLTNHARVLLRIAQDPGARLRDIAAALGITERSAYGIVTDLTRAGYVVKEKDGRRNRYQIQAHLPLPDPVGREPVIGDVLAVLMGGDAEQGQADRQTGSARESPGQAGYRARNKDLELQDLIVEAALAILYRTELIAGRILRRRRVSMLAALDPGGSCTAQIFDADVSPMSGPDRRHGRYLRGGPAAPVPQGCAATAGADVAAAAVARFGPLVDGPTSAPRVGRAAKLLPDSQPAYVASWIYVFGVGALAALGVAIASGHRQLPRRALAVAVHALVPGAGLD